MSWTALRECPRNAEIAGKLGDPTKSIPHLKSAQMKHWDYIFTHDPDLEFEARAVRIGEAHVRIELEAQWYLASYGRLLIEALPALVKRYRFAPGKLPGALQALVGRVFLDMIMSYDAYENGVVRKRARTPARERAHQPARSRQHRLRHQRGGAWHGDAVAQHPPRRKERSGDFLGGIGAGCLGGTDLPDQRRRGA
ncbi:MAG: hypothetical protein HPM95_06060 [Alphaproteobacteria bacterium]|nr:hypothetical protein [Alphaproteobacteria bacterium]